MNTSSKSKKIKCVGILTSGGDCPGLNAAIRGTAKPLIKYGIKIIGILDGFKGLIENRYIPLGEHELSGLLTIGGTILGTSRDKPHKIYLEDGKCYDMTSVAIENYHRLGLDCLICLGGGGTQKNAYHLMKNGNINIITLPKTIDNDIYGTDVSFGYDTGMSIACEAIDRLHSTASSHHRIMLVDIMGHRAGWLALGAGISGGADVILIPEIPYSIDKVLQALILRKENGKRFSIVVVAEGARLDNCKDNKDYFFVNETFHENRNELKINTNDTFIHPFKVHESSKLAIFIEKKIGLETRVTSLGYLQRGGIPTPADRILATKLGTRAGEAVLNGEFGIMIASRSQDCIQVPLSEVAGKQKLIQMDDPLIKTARLLNISIGD